MTMTITTSIDALEARLTGAGSFYALNRSASGASTFVHGPKTLCDICNKARLRTSTFLVFADRQYSYQEIFSRACGVADALQRSIGPTRGQRVVLWGDDKVEWIIGFLAIILLGASAVLLPAGKERYQVTGCRCVLLAGPAQNASNLQNVSIANMDVHAVSDLILAGDPDAHRDVWGGTSGADEALLAFTSGTSGKPKAVSVSHLSITTGLMNTLLAGALSAGGTSQTSSRNSSPPLPLLVGPLPHISGYMQVLLALLLGRAIALTGEDPPAIASFIEAAKITSLVGLSPEMGRELLVASDAAVRLNSVRSWSVAGAHVNPRYIELINNVLPGISLTNGYGLTETSGVISSTRAAAEISQASVGRIVPTVDFMIAGDDGKQLNAGEIGCLRVRGDMMMTGYCDGQGRPEPFGAWFDTGDTAYVSDQRELFILGRARELLTYRGRLLSSVDIERHLLRLTGGYEIALLSEADAIMIVIAGVTEEELALNEIRASLLHKFGISPVDITCAVCTSVPRNASGKVSNRAIRDLTEKSRGALL